MSPIVLLCTFATTAPTSALYNIPFNISIRNNRTYPMSKRTLSSLSPPDTPQTKKPRTDSSSQPIHNLTKILSWNVETPVPFLSLPARKTASSSMPAYKPNPTHLRSLLARHNFPDFLCLQEVRARHTDADWVAALRDAVNGRGLARDGGPTYTMYTSLNRAVRGPRHFGVATFARDAGAVAAAREVPWDAEGRVVILEMRAGWALVNVYALNGSEYAWRDPRGGGDGGLPKTRNERKREFNRLLMRECQAMQARGLRVVLIGDFNISLAKQDCVPRLRTEYPHALARKEFNEKFIPGLDVVDVFREVHGERKAFSWFARGKKQGEDCARVDYALVERKLLDRVVETEYLEDPKERAHSDHAPVLLVLKDMDKLDGASEVKEDTQRAQVQQASSSSQPVKALPEGKM